MRKLQKVVEQCFKKLEESKVLTQTSSLPYLVLTKHLQDLLKQQDPTLPLKGSSVNVLEPNATKTPPEVLWSQTSFCTSTE